MNAPLATDVDAALTARVAALTLERKVRLLTGATGWALAALPEIGLRSIVLSDGPAGVRGVRAVDPLPSASFPSPTALAATWDPDAVAGIGPLIASEARKQGVDVVLAPAINLLRAPYGGRHFENYSEDPLLTGTIGAAFVRGVQACGIGTTPKHFIANEAETERTTVVSTLDERTLREVYLPPFEAALEAGAWTVMAAYNQVDDGVERAPMTEHRHLLDDVLKGELGFDGVVMSDWMAARRTVESGVAGLDLVMPGPDGPWGAALVDAVRRRDVAESTIDDKVLRILRLAWRLGAIEGAPPPAVAPPVADADLRAALRRIAASAMVVLDDPAGTLPLDPAALTRVALIGPNAVEAFLQGGGSSHTNPAVLVTPEEGVRAALPGVEVVVEAGCDAQTQPPAMPVEWLADAVVEQFDDAGGSLGSTRLTATGGLIEPMSPTATRFRIRAILRLTAAGRHDLSLGVLGAHTTRVDGEVVHVEATPADALDVLESRSNNPAGARLELDVTAADVAAGGRVVEVEIDAAIASLGDFGRWTSYRLRAHPPRPSADARLASAVAVAADADLAIVVVGTTEETESEGFDRTTLALPGDQDRLVREVAAAARRTVVVVNAGGPVLLPWRDEVDAVLLAWFPGQEGGAAIADALVGAVEPAGRLPWTLPESDADVPVAEVAPTDGVLAYTEGVRVGYRAWAERTTPPAHPFGRGLGYGAWRVDDLVAPSAIDDRAPVDVEVTVTNTSRASTRTVVQVYVEPVDAVRDDRPRVQLAGFAVVDGAPGDTVSVPVRLDARAFRGWRDGAWRTLPGAVRIRAALEQGAGGVVADAVVEAPRD